MKPRHAEVTAPETASRQRLDHADCRGVTDTLARIGEKWTVQTVGSLGERPKRFSELRRELAPISQKMLTTTLRALERDGFITRTVFPTIPPKVEYALTDLGRDLLDPVRALGEWARANQHRIRDARQTFDAAEKPGLWRRQA